MFSRLRGVVRKAMSFQPERSKRFFTLRVMLKDDIPLSGRKIKM